MSWAKGRLNWDLNTDFESKTFVKDAMLHCDDVVVRQYSKWLRPECGSSKPTHCAEIEFL